MVGGMAVWLVYVFLSRSFFSFGRPPVPQQLKEARIVIGANRLSSAKFFENNWRSELTGKNVVGRISDISVADCDPHPGLEVVLAGNEGTLVLDLSGTKQAETRFQFHYDPTGGPFGTGDEYTILGDMNIVDLERDGVCEYLARGCIDGAAVFDHGGKQLWFYGNRGNENGFLRDATVGDLSRDGVAEFVVSWDGVQIFDKSGKKLTQVEEEFSDVQLEVVDTDRDGQNEIISCGGTLKIRNSNGEVIKEIDVSGYFGNYSLLQMPSSNETVLLVVYDGKLMLMDLKGQTIWQTEAPLSQFDDTVHKMPDGTELRGTSVYKAKGVWIKLSASESKYLAVITNFAAIDRSVLDIFDRSGTLIYQEILPEECDSLATLPVNDQRHPEELLVAGEETVWKYSMR